MSKKRILVTGLTGLIGRELLPLLQDKFEIYAVTRQHCQNTAAINWLTGDLFDTAFIKHACETAKAEYLINLAWIVTKDYAVSNLNFSFLASGITLLQEFHKNGGTRAFYTGSCSEYKDKATAIAEDSELDPHKNTYAFCKIKLWETAKAYCEKNGLSFVYGRIFNIYGNNEEEKRLSSQIIKACQTDTEVIIKSGPLFKDYMYSKDAARAIKHLLLHAEDGTYNICSGTPVSIRDFALTLAGYYGKTHLLTFKDDFGSQAPINFGNNEKLRQSGFQSNYTLQQGLHEIAKLSAQAANTGTFSPQPHKKP